MDKFWHNKQVLVTGASGFVGSNAISFFSKKGAKVTAAISPHTSSNLFKKRVSKIKHVKLIKTNLLNSKNTDNICKNIDIVMNFAAVDGSLDFKTKHSADIFSQNIKMQLNLLESSVKNKVKTYLLISSSDIYTQTEKSLSEESPININFHNKTDGYKLAKWSSELIAREFSNQYGINIIIVRPSNIYGPGDNFKDLSRIRFIPSVINSVYSDNKPVVLWGSGRQSRSFLYVADFLEICSKLIEKNVCSTPINVASKNQLSLKLLAKKIIKISNKKTKLITDASKPGGANKRQFNLKLLDAKIGKVSETKIDEGLKKTILYYKKYIKSS